jgi:Rrf2 family protein
MKLSRTVSYALQATLQLAQYGSDTPVPCSRLAAEGKMPERFLLQILRNLVAHGILGSTRGVEGGYTLERAPEEISLLQVIEAIEGPLTSALPAGEGLPEESRIRLEQALAEVTEVARRELEAIKLAQLLPRPSSPEMRTRGGAAAGLPEELPH